MPEIPEGLKLFQLATDEMDELQQSFEPVFAGLNLANKHDLTEFVSKYKTASGIYFCLMRHESDNYKIYIGQTKSIANRVLNYMSAFQPHSPNDSKLQVFQEFIIELLPTATLDLYFSPQDPSNLTRAETEANRKYRPLFYRLPPPSAESKNKLMNAFMLYYRAAFEERLK